jgi:hypothetical protein
MGFWSNTFGGGNSFSQSVSNATTPNDGNTYVGGQATSTSSGAVRPRARPANFAATVAAQRSPEARANTAALVNTAAKQDSDASAAKAAAEQERLRKAAAVSSAAAAAEAETQRLAREAEAQRIQKVEAAAQARREAALKDLQARSKASLAIDDARFGPVDQRTPATNAEARSQKNSAYESFMNRMTPRDGKQYIGGQLYDTQPEELYSYQPDTSGALGIFGRGLNALSGARAGDPIVGVVDGKSIYQRSDGSTYSVNRLGLTYDTVSATSTEAATRTPDPSDDMNARSGSDEPTRTAEVVEGVVEDINPCPEGYMMDEETKVCVIDPFQTPFPVTQPQQPAAPQALSQYSSVSPIGLPTLNPVQQSPFVVPTPTVQPITVAQQGLASLPFRSS